MGKKSSSSRDWAQIYAIYGLEELTTLLLLLLAFSTLFSLLSFLFFLHFTQITSFLVPILPPGGSPRFAAAFLCAMSGITSLCLFFAAYNFFYSSVTLQWEMSQRMVGVIGDWSRVRTALDVGCGRGILLNAVALQMKKEGSRGRVVGVDEKKGKVGLKKTLKRAGIEGVQEYVTCREGDVRRLPFNDGFFDVVVSGAYLHRVGKEHGQKTAAAAAERVRVLGEVVRVLKPGGVGVVWDLVHVPEYVRKLQELRMEDIRVSERVTAYLMSSHIVSFRKPVAVDSHGVVGLAGNACHEVRLDWR